MKRYFLFSTVIVLTLFSCSKEEGKGGRSSIKGKVHLTNVSNPSKGDYDIPDYDVYIIYGDKDDIYDDDMKTNFDGTFEFKNLREGSYRIFAYTKDFVNLIGSGVSPVFKSAEIEGNEQVDVGTIEVEK